MISSEQKKKLRKILEKVSTPEELREFDNETSNEKLDNISSVFGQLAYIKGKDGKDGYTPQKGKDYFSKSDIEWFLAKTMPIKGVDYVDGIDGKNGVNGSDGEIPAHRWTKTLLQFQNPDKSYGEMVNLQGEKGDKGDIPKHEWKGTKLRFESPDGKWGKLIDLKGKDGASSRWLSPGGWIGGGISKFTQLADVPQSYTGNSGKVLKVNPTEDGLIFGTGGSGGGTVDSVVAGTGISVNSTDPINPIVTNSAPDRTVAITAGTNITSVTGTYPNFTVNAATQTTTVYYSKNFTITNPTASKYFKGWRVPVGITITAVHLNCSGNVVVGQLWQFDSNGLNGSTVGTDITGVIDTNVNNGAMAGASITAGNYLGWHTTSVTGTPTYAYITFDYTIT